MAKKLLKKKLKKADTPLFTEQPKKNIYDTLDDVIDKTHLFTMIYSGVEQDEYFDTLYSLGIRDYLMSYHYLRKKRGGNDLSHLKELNIRLFIDSGAYTYQVDSKYRNYTVEQWENQIQEYLAWAKTNKDIIYAIADLDLQELVGIEKVTEWRRKYFEPFMLETGIPVCFIWHNVEGYEGLERTCQRYPYIGVSWTTDDENDGIKILKIAEKHGTVVHGMGMTRTSQLTKLPLFTCDSTTWLVGLKYGEVNYWRGKKMSRLKKEKWKGEYLQKILNKYEKYNIDKDKLLAEDTLEMIKVNVLAFMEAQEYIRTKLKSRMYWLKPKLQEQSLDNIKFPPVKWITEKNYTDIETYAHNLNVGLDNQEVGLVNIIDATCFCNWDNPELQDYINEVYTEELVQELHDLHINKITSSHEERVQDLIKFYTECVEGKNDALLLMGGDFQRKAMERDSYIEEEEYDLEDVSIEEINKELATALPSGEEAPEIDALDDEIFRNIDLIPIRDEKGRFLKGQRKVHKQKNVYSSKYPKLACDSCYSAQNCPEFKAGYVCAYNKMLKRFDTRNMSDILDAMHSMVNLNMERMQRVAIFEMLDGGMPDGNLTMMIDQNMRLLKMMKDLNEVKPMLTRKTTINADGSTSEVVQAQGGIMEKLMKQMLEGNNKSEDEDTKINNSDVVEVDDNDIKVEP